MSIERREFAEFGDRVALICDDDATAATLKGVLEAMEFRCHLAETADRAIERMRYNTYDVVMLSDTFSGATLESNSVLRYLALLPMAQRRNTYTVLVGASFRTLDAMQAYAQSVHLVVNPADLQNLGAILKKGLHEFEAFYRIFRAVLAEAGESG